MIQTANATWNTPILFPFNNAAFSDLVHTFELISVPVYSVILAHHLKLRGDFYYFFFLLRIPEESVLFEQSIRIFKLRRMHLSYLCFVTPLLICSM